MLWSGLPHSLSKRGHIGMLFPKRLVVYDKAMQAKAATSQRHDHADVDADVHIDIWNKITNIYI